MDAGGDGWTSDERGTDYMPKPNRAWRSDGPITVERWIQAREIHGLDLDAFAAKYEMDVEFVRAIEDGRTQPSRALLYEYAAAMGFKPKFFFLPPPDPEFSAALAAAIERHSISYVCDVCEAKTGQEVEADYRCVDCERDLCVEHMHWLAPGAPHGREIVLCRRCLLRRKRPQARQMPLFSAFAKEYRHDDPHR